MTRKRRYLDNNPPTVLPINSEGLPYYNLPDVDVSATKLPKAKTTDANIQRYADAVANGQIKLTQIPDTELRNRVRAKPIVDKIREDTNKTALPVLAGTLGVPASIITAAELAPLVAPVASKVMNNPVVDAALTADGIINAPSRIKENIEEIKSGEYGTGAIKLLLNGLDLYGAYKLGKYGYNTVDRLINHRPYKNSLTTTGKGSHYLTHTINSKTLEKIVKESDGMIPAPSIAITKDPNFDYSTGYTFYFDPKYIDDMKHVASPVDMYSPTWKNAETWANKKLSPEEVVKTKEEMLSTLGRLRETQREADYTSHTWRKRRSIFDKLINRDRSLKSATRRLDMSYLFGNKHSAYGEVMPLEMVDLKKAVAVRPDAFNSTKNKTIEDFFTKYGILFTDDISKISRTPNLTY